MWRRQVAPLTNTVLFQWLLNFHILLHPRPRLLRSGPSPSGTHVLRPCSPASVASSHDTYTELTGSSVGSSLSYSMVVPRDFRTSTAGGSSQVPSISITISDSRMVIVSPHRAFTSVQSMAYWHQ